jgi:hypothetical protein
MINWEEYEQELFQQCPGETDENPAKPQSEQPVSRMGSNLGLPK